MERTLYFGVANGKNSAGEMTWVTDISGARTLAVMICESSCQK